MWQVNTRKAEIDFLERRQAEEKAASLATANDDLAWSRHLDEGGHPPERPARPLTKVLFAVLMILFVALTLYLAL